MSLTSIFQIFLLGLSSFTFSYSKIPATESTSIADFSYLLQDVSRTSQGVFDLLKTAGISEFERNSVVLVKLPYYYMKKSNRHYFIIYWIPPLFFLYKALLHNDNYAVKWLLPFLINRCIFHIYFFTATCSILMQLRLIAILPYRFNKLI